MLTRIDRTVALVNVLGNCKRCKHCVGFGQYLKKGNKGSPHNHTISLLGIYLTKYWICSQWCIHTHIKKNHCYTVIKRNSKCLIVVDLYDGILYSKENEWSFPALTWINHRNRYSWECTYYVNNLCKSYTHLIHCCIWLRGVHIYGNIRS